MKPGEYQSPPPVGSEEHLDERTWEKLSCGELPPEVRERAVEHIVGCPSCARVYRGLEILRAEASAFDSTAPSRPIVATAPTRRWLWIGGAATAAAAAVVTLVVALPPGGSVRDGRSRPNALRSVGGRQRVVGVAPRGIQRRAPRSLRWRNYPRAQRYRVSVFAETGRLLREIDGVQGTTVSWPTGLRLRPGRYFWQVEALRLGSPIARSDLVSFSIEE